MRDYFAARRQNRATVTKPTRCLTCRQRPRRLLVARHMMIWRIYFGRGTPLSPYQRLQISLLNASLSRRSELHVEVGANIVVRQARAELAAVGNTHRRIRCQLDV